MKCRKAYAIIPVGENDRSAHVAQQKAPEVATPGLFYSVLGDEKNMSDAGCNKWGHDGGHSVVEFVVNKSMWYHTGKTVTRFHPEWAKSRVVKAVNLN